MPTLSIDLPDSTYRLLLAMVKQDGAAIPPLAAHLIRQAISERDYVGRARDRRPAAERVRSAIPRVMAPMVGRVVPISTIRNSLGMALSVEADLAIPAALRDAGWVPVRNGGSVIRWAHKDHIPAGFSPA